MFLKFDFNVFLLGNSNGILSIQHIECESLGNLKDYFLADGFRVSEILVTKQKLPDRIDDFNAIVILGGPISANDDFEYLKKEMQIVINSIKLEIPILGVCLGSQIIAKSCGAKIFSGPKKEIGWGKVDITDSGKNSLFKGIDERKINVFHWHGDTFELPADAAALSYSDLYIQSFEYKTAFGIQFHLEVTQQMILEWMQVYQKELLSEKIDKQDILFDIDNKSKNLASYLKIVYNNFRSLIR